MNSENRNKRKLEDLLENIENRLESEEMEPVIEEVAKDHPDVFSSLKEYVKDHVPHDFQSSKMVKGKNDFLSLIKRKHRYAVMRKVSLSVIILGIIVASVVYYNPGFINQMGNDSSHQSFSELEDHVIRANDAHEHEKYDLPDGSLVFLEPNSKISFQDDFISNRTVHLEGSAFFSVKHLDGNRFKVISSRLSTVVLGTEFLVSDFAHENEARVSVSEGSVNVSTADNELALPPQVLVQNENITFKEQQKSFEKETRDSIFLESQGKIKLIYNKTRVTEVIKDLEKHYKVVFNYKASEFETCTVTGSFEQKNLEQTLYVLSRLLNLSYTIENNIVQLYGKGC